MWFSKIKKHTAFRFFTNIYSIIVISFIIWMLFFDENSYLLHRKLDNEINDSERAIQIYKSKINEYETMIEKLEDSSQLERFAREQYLLKKENEDIYFFEFDTIDK